MKRSGFTLVETDAIDSIEMLHLDVVKPILAYECPRAIKEYLERHQFKKNFDYVAGRAGSGEVRKYLKHVMEEGKISELAFR
jgi:hypothetical protein